MGVAARRWNLPLYLTDLTRNACRGLLDGSEDVRAYTSAQPVEIDGLVVTPFLTVHDAIDPVAVTVTERQTGAKLGIATDLGRATAPVRHALQGCDVLVLESNHDEILLRESPYPWSVKARIGGSHGHLSNRAAAELVGELFHDGLCAVVLAHMSEAANDPSLARDVVGYALEKRRFKGDARRRPPGGADDAHRRHPPQGAPSAGADGAILVSPSRPLKGGKNNHLATFKMMRYFILHRSRSIHPWTRSSSPMHSRLQARRTVALSVPFMSALLA